MKFKFWKSILSCEIIPDNQPRPSSIATTIVMPDPKAALLFLLHKSAFRFSTVDSRPFPGASKHFSLKQIITGGSFLCVFFYGKSPPVLFSASLFSSSVEPMWTKVGTMTPLLYRRPVVSISFQNTPSSPYYTAQSTISSTPQCLWTWLLPSPSFFCLWNYFLLVVMLYAAIRQ